MFIFCSLIKRDQFWTATNPPTVALWLAGLFYLFATQEGKGYRPIGWMFIIPFSLLVTGRGRGYSFVLKRTFFGLTLEKVQRAFIVRLTSLSSRCVFGVARPRGRSIVAYVSPLVRIDNER